MVEKKVQPPFQVKKRTSNPLLFMRPTCLLNDHSLMKMFNIVPFTCDGNGVVCDVTDGCQGQ